MERGPSFAIGLVFRDEDAVVIPLVDVPVPDVA
jgi:hypothetical protein